MSASPNDEHLNALIEAYLHEEADEMQLKELAAWAEADLVVARRIGMTSMICARFRAESDASFVAETMAAASPRKGDSGFVRRVMEDVRQGGGEQATRLVLPVRATEKPRTPQHPSHVAPAAHRSGSRRSIAVETESVQSHQSHRVVRGKRNWMWVAGGTLAAMVMLSLFASFVLPSGAGRIARLTTQGNGGVIERDGHVIRVTSSADLENGDIVQSEQDSLRFRFFSDSTSIDLGTDTRVKIVLEENVRRLELLSGRLEAVVAHQAPGHSVKLTTSHAEVKVIGTRFSLRESDRFTRLEVQEGKVNMTRRQDGASLDVPAGMGSIATPTASAPMTLTKLDRVSDGLIAHYRFDESNGPTTEEQMGGSMAVLHGAKWTEGRNGSGLMFTGQDYVDFSNAPQINFGAGAPFTYSGWFKTTAHYGMILSQRNRGDEGADIDIAIGNNGGGVAAGKLMALVRPNGRMIAPYPQVTGGVVNDGAWHHFALTRDPEGTIELFLDGIAQGRSSNSVSKQAITTNMRAFGAERYWFEIASAHAFNTFFTGCLDDIRVYNRVLSSAEVQQLSR
jgi:hypothetical protein